MEKLSLLHSMLKAFLLIKNRQHFETTELSLLYASLYARPVTIQAYVVSRVFVFHTDKHIPGSSHHRRLAVICHVQLRRSRLDDWYSRWR